MFNRINSTLLLAATTLLLTTTYAGLAEARGGGFSRTGAASSGSFSSGAGTQRPARQVDVHHGGTAGERLEDARDNLEQRRDQAGDRLDNRGDWRDDDYYDDDYGAHWDDHWQEDPGAGSTTNTATAGYVTELPCSGASFTVGDEVYYECENSWFRRGFMGGMLVYLPSGPPPGS